MYLGPPCYGYTRNTSVMHEKTKKKIIICNCKSEIQICSNKLDSDLVCLIATTMTFIDKTKIYSTISVQFLIALTMAFSDKTKI